MTDDVPPSVGRRRRTKRALDRTGPETAGTPPRGPDPAILRIARALARQAAREDHARELAEKAKR